MGRDKQKLAEVVLAVVEQRKDQVKISPSSIATEVMNVLDPESVSVVLVALGCHLQIRQIARDCCRELFESDLTEGSAQHELFPDLQARYPAARQNGDEPVYVRLEDMTNEDIEHNVRRLRSEARAKLKHADALEAWAMQREVLTPEPV